MDVVRAAFEQLGWNMTPVNALEEQVAVLQHEVEILNEQSDGWQIEASRLEEQHEALTHERDFLREENAGKDSEVRVLEEQFGAAQAALREIAATDWFNGEDRFAGPDDIARSALASFPATSSAPDRNAGAEVPLREAIEKALGYTAGSELPEEIESLLSNPASDPDAKLWESTLMDGLEDDPYPASEPFAGLPYEEQPFAGQPYEEQATSNQDDAPASRLQ